MVSMLAAIADEMPERPTWYVHGALNGRVHALRDATAAAASGRAHIRVRTFYAQPDAQDRRGEHYDEAGLITADWLVANTPQAEAVYYLCGPKLFLAALVNGLQRHGVPAERVRFEFFGPADELLEDEVRRVA